MQDLTKDIISPDYLKHFTYSDLERFVGQLTELVSSMEECKLLYVEAGMDENAVNIQGEIHVVMENRKIMLDKMEAIEKCVFINTGFAYICEN